MELLLWIFLLTIKSVYSIMFSLPNMRLKDMLTVMTSELLLLCTVAIGLHIETDNTLTQLTPNRLAISEDGTQLFVSYFERELRTFNVTWI